MFDAGTYTCLSGAFMLRRIFAVLIILGGLVLIIAPVTEHIWTGAAPANSMINSFKPAMTASSLHVIQDDLQQLSAANHQMTAQLIPALASQLHLSSSQLQQIMSTKFPAVQTGLTQLPSILNNFDGFGVLLQSQLTNFHEASTIPIKGVPLTTLPWGFLLVGVIAVVIGIVMFLRKSMAAALAALVLGIAVVLGSVALSFPHKAVSADHLITSLRPVMSAQNVLGMGQSLGVVGAMTTQLETQMLPYVAAQLNMSASALEGFLGSQFPAVATAFQNMPSTAATFEGLHTNIANNVSNYNKAAQIPSMTFLVWLFVGVGAICFLGGVVALATDKKESKLAPEPT